MRVPNAACDKFLAFLAYHFPDRGLGSRLRPDMKITLSLLCVSHGVVLGFALRKFTESGSPASQMGSEGVCRIRGVPAHDVFLKSS